MSDEDSNDLKSAWVGRVLNVTLPGATALSAEAALAQWAERRAGVLASLKALERAIRAMGDPLGDRAVILVRAIAANITAEPKTKQSVVELRRYLETDSIIDDAELPNGFGIAVNIRAPLLGALDGLEQSLRG